MTDPKPTRIVYPRPPRKRPAPAVAAVLTGCCTVTATTPGKPRHGSVDSEQRMQNYRARIRAKLQARGVPDEELERRTDQIFHARLRFNFGDLIAE